MPDRSHGGLGQRIALAVMLTAPLLGAGCTGKQEVGPRLHDPTGADVDGGRIVDDALADTHSDLLDPGRAPDLGDTPAEDGAGSEVDARSPWSIGDPCKGNEDCPGGWCVEVDEGKVGLCTLSCVSLCPSGWTCRAVTALGPDAIFVCVPLPARVCAPCSGASECGALAVCARAASDEGEEAGGGLCLLSCGSAEGYCATGFGCEAREALAGGDQVLVCAPEGSGGCCAAVTEGRREPCARENEHGRCTAERVCRGTAGWSACPAREPAAEICNAGDDDCDGLVDEDLPVECACGDGVCAPPGGEEPATCPCDCHECGDGACAPCGESPGSCPEDCCRSEEGTEGCGDGHCLGPVCGEDGLSCPEDCGSDCGNGVCEGGESPWLCAADCSLGECGNGVCEPTDGGAEICPEDCAAYCGDCVCGDGGGGRPERHDTCPIDCGYCGDGVCSACPSLGEDGARCPADCCVAAPETCNGKDDDCDGETDEGFGVGEPCEDPPGGPCFAGVTACVSSEAVACSDASKRPPGAPCGGYRCAVGFAELPGGCSEEGLCREQGWADCGGPLCAGDERCAEGCLDHAGCRPGYACTGSACLARRAVCETNEDCIDGDPCTVDLCDSARVCGRYPREPCGPGEDADGDGVLNGDDLCPEHADPEQEDLDEDGVGDACDDCVTVAATEERCDGRDDDCDGLTDEDFGVGRACPAPDEPCARFEITCVGARESACRRVGSHPRGIECAEPTCEGGVFTDKGTCDGDGLCLAGRVGSCAPYACADDRVCADRCTPGAGRGGLPGEARTSGCMGDRYCLRGVCLPLAEIGAPCTEDAACGSGHCADERCCDDACTETCMGCALPGKLGTCSRVRSAPDPDSCTGERSCDGEGACRLHVGAPCRTAAECLSESCADGACCASACEGVCESCALEATAGRCVPVRLDEDPGSCDGAYGCDSTGRCHLKHGRSCARDGACISGFCVDGVCCTSACHEPCRRCDRPGRRGTCTPRTEGEDPDGCAGVATCDGAGRCKLREGAVCRHGEDCLSGFCADGVCCDSPCAAPCRGCTRPGSVGTCAAMLNVEQPGRCEDGWVCDPAGSCVQRRGQPCDSEAECASEHCVDGFCCDRACDGTCEACDVGGSEGTCAAFPAGTDPEEECGTCRACDGRGKCAALREGADPKDDCAPEPGCGRDGECDGAGSCRLRGAETVCGPASCEDAVLSLPDLCDGAGGCADGGEVPCPGGLACDEPEPGAGGGDPSSTSCRATCARAEDCAEGFYCASGACLSVKPVGRPCARDLECASGECADGVCCLTPCPGACEACALSEREGVCALAPAGQDPRALCGAGQACDGAGSCAGKEGAPCEVDRECLGGICADGRCCDARCEGGCRACDVPGRLGACSPVPRGADPAEECSGDEVCDGQGACAAPEGHACERAADCLSGACAQGVCCASACGEACHSCALPDSRGSCEAVPAGLDPAGDCGTGGACDGAGGCAALPGTSCGGGTPCLSAHCSDGVCCDEPCDGGCESCALEGGVGSCNPVPAGSDPDSECEGSRVCDGAGTCALEDGEACATGEECLSGFCDGGTCCASACDLPCSSCDIPASPGLCLPAPRGTDPRGDCPGEEICDGAGGCARPDGAACGEDAECLGGACADGLCCDEPCDGPCHACDLEGALGRCALLPPGSDPDGDCPGEEICGAAGSCVRPDGAVCASQLECLHGACSDSVCCEHACEGPCHACNLDGELGRCAPVPRGEDPRGACPGEQVCDGAGTCALPDGQPCEADADCLSRACVDGLCCEHGCAGTCVSCATAAAPGSCAAVEAGSDPDDECEGDEVCGGDGACVRGLGEGCADAGDCMSGHCVDGFCCSAACEGLCESCGQADLEGRCEPLPVESDPDNECPGPDACDGQGSCRQYVGETCSDGGECLSGHCSDRVCCDEPCEAPCTSCALAGSLGSCAPVPLGQDPDGDCESGRLCDGAGGCALPEGQACGGDGECLSGACTDGLCCAARCDGGCEACDLPGALGRCVPVPARQDPAAECPGEAACNGAGACASPEGEPCVDPADCLSGICADELCCERPCEGACESCRLADSEGSCEAIPAGADPDEECAGDEICGGGGACVRPDGAGCEVDGDCLSGFCADGLCCDTRCTATCESCRLDGAEGRCSPIGPGADPDEECEGEQVCDGSGRCVEPKGAPCEAGSDCLSGHCADGLCCDEACGGTCRACDLAGSLGGCGAVDAGQDPDEECPGARVCDGTGRCVGDDGQSCEDGADCLSGRCVDALCCDRDCDGLCERCDLSASEGRCAPVPRGSDAEEECAGSGVCDGAGSCATREGDACGHGGDCLSGFCADGLCCDAVCGGRCEACNVGGSEGVCAAIEAGLDPDDECAGDEICDGERRCVRAAGKSCEEDQQCLSSRCADGLCCDAACDGLCEACDLPGAFGDCTSLPRGADPDEECAGVSVCDGGDRCVLPEGEECSSGDDCESRRCVDGRCCESLCDGLCEACDLAGAEGRCVPVEEGEDPANECAGTKVCDGSGACVGLDGEPCSERSECLSGYCANGRCCGEACDGPCRSCGLSGSLGVCTMVPRGEAPPGGCEADEVCDGAGRCVLGDGLPCTAGGDCLSGWCADGVCCAENGCPGTCRSCAVAGLEGACAFVAVASDPDSECPDTEICDGGGSCVRVQGSECTRASDCLGARCADGRCCESPCDGVCERCDGALPGVCVAVASADDPDTCAGTHTCDAAGGCKKKDGQVCGDGGECSSGFCADGVCCASACDGSCRSCSGASPGECTAVTGVEDPDTCSGDSTCDASGSCKPKQGQPCIENDDCASEHCVDGLCCDRACAGLCEACDIVGSEGVCSALPSGVDPAGECGDGERCDGALGCALTLGRSCLDDADCLSESCVDFACCSDAGCAGTCRSCALPGSEGSCASLARGSDPEEECTGSQVCDGDAGCVKANGDGCEASAECLGGSCADGYCCDAACDGVCESCALFGFEGSCSRVASGEDPDEECDGAASCDGAGSCRKATGEPCGGGGECFSGHCADGLCCDTGCEGLCHACDIAGSAGTCAAVEKGADPDEECEDSAACDGAGACASADGGGCATAGDCLSGHCAGEVCCAEACDEHPNSACVAGTGACSCAPSCAGVVCGGDGCGGSCGTCPPGLVCAEGACDAPPGWVLVPAGSFTMGSPSTEPHRSSREGPQHTVRITRPFLLRETELTQGEWLEIMGSNYSYNGSCGLDCPKEMVSWQNALEYLNALSGAEGLDSCYSGFSWPEGPACTGYRLPTEAEWEYAARAGDTGAVYGPLDQVAWWNGNSSDETHPGGTKSPNAWGLYDMIGNAWEAVWDFYGEDYYGTRPNPDTDPTGPATGSGRVYRGCGYGNYEDACRAAYRLQLGYHYYDSGTTFRPARTLTQTDPIPPPGPPAPALGSITRPTWPATGTPVVNGTAQAGLAVQVFAASDCSGEVVGSGSAGEGGTFALEVDVPAAAEITLTAVTLDTAERRSECSDVLVADLRTAPFRLSFQPASSPLPPGVDAADNGLGFDEARGYGWLDTEGQPLDMSAQMVARPFTGMAPAEETFAYVGANAESAPDTGTWRLLAPNGTHYLNLVLSDPRFNTGPACVTVQGSVVVSETAAFSGERWLVADHAVVVEDGTLTVQIGCTTGDTKLAWLALSHERLELPVPVHVDESRWPAASGHLLDQGQAFDGTIGWDEDRSAQVYVRNTSTCWSNAVPPKHASHVASRYLTGGDPPASVGPDVLILDLAAARPLPAGESYAGPATVSLFFWDPLHRVASSCKHYPRTGTVAVNGRRVVREFSTTGYSPYTIRDFPIVVGEDQRVRIDLGGELSDTSVNRATPLAAWTVTPLVELPTKLVFNFGPENHHHIAGSFFASPHRELDDRDYYWSGDISGPGARTRAQCQDSWGEASVIIFNPNVTAHFHVPLASFGLENGTYEVEVWTGDCAFEMGPHVVSFEGVEALSQSSAAGEILKTTATVEVDDGVLDMSVGPSTGYPAVNLLSIERTGN